MLRKAILVAALIASALWLYKPQQKHLPGVIAQDAPRQHKPQSKTPFEFRGHTFIPLASFSIKARVLSKRHYRLDRESKLSPVDLALGWGSMSDAEVLKSFRISQSNRWYSYRTVRWPIPKDEVAQNSANMHMVPATLEIESLLKKTVRGDIVFIQGQLVEIQAADGWRWKSSLTRKDTGKGSCELVLVEHFEITQVQEGSVGP